MRGEQSAEVLDLRMTCLQERLGGLRALTDVFSEANGEVVENAVSAANTLGSLDRCADVPLLRSIVRPPEDSATRARVAALRHRLAAVKALFDAGRYREALKAAPRLRRRGARARLPAAGRRGAARWWVRCTDKANDSRTAEKTADRFVPGGRRLPTRRGSRRRRHRAGLGRRLPAGALRRGPALGQARARRSCSASAGTSSNRPGCSTTWVRSTCSRANRSRRCSATQEALALKETGARARPPGRRDLGGEPGGRPRGAGAQPGGARARRSLDRDPRERPRRGAPRSGDPAQQPRRDPERARALARRARLVREGAHHLGARARAREPQPRLRADRHRRQLPLRGRSAERDRSRSSGPSRSARPRRPIPRGAPRRGSRWRARCGSRGAIGCGRARWPRRRARVTPRRR